MPDIQYKNINFPLTSELSVEEDCLFTAIDNEFSKEDIFIEIKDGNMVVHLNKIDLEKLQNVIINSNVNSSSIFMRCWMRLKG